MRRLHVFAVAFLAVGLMAGDSAFAQGRGQGRGRGFGGGMFGGGGLTPAMMLLGQEQIQKELKITDEQKGKITEIQREGFGAGRRGGGQGFPNFQDMSQEERDKFFADMRKRNEENNQKMLAVLTPDQTTRFKQVQLWASGSQALSDEGVAKELGITDEQKDTIKTINEEAQKKRGEMFAGFDFQNATDEERTKLREKGAELTKEIDGELMAVLTDAQKAKLDKLKGEKFDYQPPAFGGGRGRRGRPNNN